MKNSVIKAIMLCLGILVLSQLFSRTIIENENLLMIYSASTVEPDCNCENSPTSTLHYCVPATEYDDGQVVKRYCYKRSYYEETCDCNLACGWGSFPPCDNPN